MVRDRERWVRGGKGELKERAKGRRGKKNERHRWGGDEREGEGAEVISSGERKRERGQAGGGRISTSLGRKGRSGKGQILSFKRTVYPGDRPRQQIITEGVH